MYTKNPGQADCQPRYMTVFVWGSYQYQTYLIDIPFFNISDVALTEEYLYPFSVSIYLFGNICLFLDFNFTYEICCVYPAFCFAMPI